MIIPDPLYDQIKHAMPIPCVDLLVKDPDGFVLLVRRVAPPAAGEWWFPGGRVHVGEHRSQAAIRKLLTECGIRATEVSERGTFDLLLPLEATVSHSITTLYEVRLETRPPLQLDPQSSEAEWRTVEQWLQRRLNPFVRDRLTRA